MSTLASDPPVLSPQFTPTAAPGPPRPRLHFQSYSHANDHLKAEVHGESSRQARQALRELPYAPPSDLQQPPSPSPSKPPNHRRRPPTPPPELDDDEIAMAEEFDVEDLVPPSSPPPPSTPPKPVREYRPSGAAVRAAALAALNATLPNLPRSSSPDRPTKLPRVEASTSRHFNAEAGPSEPAFQQPRKTEVAVRHPWSKEVEGKLRTYFKLPGFRLHQRDAIDQTMAGKDGKI